MMGEQGDGQDRLFYPFNLDEHVPQDHLLRGIDQFLDLSDLRQHLASHYSNTDRPSIDPELMICMLVIGDCFGIRSERRSCEPDSAKTIAIPIGIHHRCASAETTRLKN
jgi:transposase